MSAMGIVYDQMGRPEKAEDYVVPEIDDQGIALNMDLADTFKTVAHKHGLSKEQYQGVIKELTEVSIEATLKSKAAVDADVKSLVDEWGGAYDRNKAIAIAIAKQTGAPPNLVLLLEGTTPPTELAKYFHSLSASLKGEGVNLTAEPGNTGVMTPSDAISVMTEMRENREHPLNVPSSSGHKAALQKFSNLIKYAYPEARA